MPIASIIPPGTLSVQAILLNQSSSVSVPLLNFTSLRFTDRFLNSGMEAGGGSALTFDYNGPSQIVESIARAVSAQGTILTITPPSPNSTWQLEFYGPALQCGNMSDTRREQVLANIGDYYAQIGPASYASTICEDGRFLYLSWFQDLPFVNQSSFNQSTFSISDASLSSDPGSNATISIVTLPAMITVNDPCADFPSSQEPGNNQNVSFVDPNLSTADQNPLGTVGERAGTVECQLYNSTYRVNFEYVNGLQNVTIDAPVTTSDTPFTTFAYVGQQQSCNSSYCPTNCFAFQPSASSASFPDPCDFDPDIIRAIAYQGIMEAFVNLLSGTIGLPDFGPLTSNTSVLGTALVNTNELDFLNDQGSNYLWTDWNTTGGAVDDLQGVLGDVGIDVPGIAQGGTSTPNQSLSSALEEMFRNYTVSLMSSSLLQ